MQETLEDPYSLPFVRMASMPFLEANFNLINEQSALDELEKVLLDSTNLDELLMLDLNTQLAEPDNDLSFVDFSLFTGSIFSDSSQEESEAVNQEDSLLELGLLKDEQSSKSSFSLIESPVELNSSKEPFKQSADRVEKVSVGISKNKLAAQKYRSKKLQLRDKLYADLEYHEKINKDLKTKVEDIQVEINLIKTLLVQVYLDKK